MKKSIPYIIAALIGFFICPVSCLAAGVYYYEFGWIEPCTALIFVVITWCCRGEDGFIADFVRTVRGLRK